MDNKKKDDLTELIIEDEESYDTFIPNPKKMCKDKHMHRVKNCFYCSREVYREFEEFDSERLLRDFDTAAVHDCFPRRLVKQYYPEEGVGKEKEKEKEKKEIEEERKENET